MRISDWSSDVCSSDLIKVDNYIGTVDPFLTINQCIQTGNPFFCDLFNRDPATGVIFGTNGYITATTLNTGYLKSAGIDATASYSFGLDTLGLNDGGKDRKSTRLNSSH